MRFFQANVIEIGFGNQCEHFATSNFVNVCQ